MQRRVERPLLHLQHLARDLLDPLRDRPAMRRLEREGLQDQEIEGALHEIGRSAHMPRLSTMYYRRSRRSFRRPFDWEAALAPRVVRALLLTGRLLTPSA